MTGAEIVIECLKGTGVDTVFGYPGGAILNIYDALYQHFSMRLPIFLPLMSRSFPCGRRICQSHRKVGAWLPAPVLTNLVTEATAYMDSVPVVAVLLTT